VPREAGLIQARTVHVVAGVIRDEQGNVLLAQRPAGKHLAGLWEFPGGKCEPGESATTALRRELGEEIGITLDAIEPLIAVPWRYPEKSILLDVYEVRGWQGVPHGREGQALRWSPVAELATLPVPPADRPVVTALRLPSRYAITPEPEIEDADFLRSFQQLLDAGHTLIQLRCKSQPTARVRTLAQAACAMATKVGASVLISGNVELAKALDCGVHLPSANLMACDSRPLPSDRWVAASCHDARELEHAAAIGVDFAVLGPVLPTRSHPHAATLGWERFADLARLAAMPVYALGGVGSDALAIAKRAGAQGVAGISAFWPCES
jgi:8-oxo-dGTP diphosphatase